MDCDKMRDIILTDYIDGRLTGQALQDVEAHLASCAGCRGLASELVSVGAELGKSRHQKPSSEVWERIRSEVNRPPVGVFSAPDLLRSARSVFARLRPAITVAAAAALILVVLIAGHVIPYNTAAKAPVGEEEILSMAAMDEHGGADYDFGTPEEDYFL